MKKIINGKLYDTDTAKELAVHSNTSDIRDFRHYTERLYIKRTGEYFLYGEGGPMTRYSRHERDGWTGGEAIIPLTVKEAKKWAEDHMDADEYMDTFGPVEE